MPKFVRTVQPFGCVLLVVGLCGALGAAALWAQNSKAQETKALDRQTESYLREKFAKQKDLAQVHTTVDDRVVTLSGTVANLRAKLNAEHDARQVNAVDGVVDKIEVETETVPDAQLQREISDRLVYDRMGMGQTFNGLTLKVHGGMVTVGGQVVDYPARDSAVDIIVGTKGVKGIVDNIQVAPVSPMDDQIRMAAARAIYGNPALRLYANNPSRPIRILVKNGHVTLVGVVDTPLAKTVAGNAVRSLPGVFSVKNDLVVAGGN